MSRPRTHVNQKCLIDASPAHTPTSACPCRAGPSRTRSGAVGGWRGDCGPFSPNPRRNAGRPWATAAKATTALQIRARENLHPMLDGSLPRPSPHCEQRPCSEDVSRCYTLRQHGRNSWCGEGRGRVLSVCPIPHASTTLLHSRLQRLSTLQRPEAASAAQIHAATTPPTRLRRSIM